jgi:predicted HTH transcriptional regulator
MPETNVSKQPRGLKELFANFIEDPTRSGFREILQNHYGETKFLDFKANWEVPSKLAKHVLGLANSQGGALIIGVLQKSDNSFEPIGLEKFEDPGDITKAVRRFLPTKVVHEVLSFYFEEAEYGKLKGKKFQLLIVQDTPKYVPFVSTSEGEGIRKNVIYIRRQGETAEANYDELQEVINRRIETQYSSKNEQQLEKALAELKVLCNSIPQYIERCEYEYEQSLDLVRNDEYPKESYAKFVRKLIQRKKQQILEIADTK